MKRKYELADFALYDYAYVQRHLEEMAAKGWRLDKAGLFGIWRYAAAEPARVRYEVTYVPVGDMYNPWPREQELELEDYCAEAGWEKVAASGPMHIYCNEDPDAVPIETDERVRHQTIKASMKRHLLPSRIVMMALFALQWILQLVVVSGNPVRTLSSGVTGLTIVELPVCIVLYGLDLWGYLHWMRRSEQAIRDGLACPEGKFYRTFRIVVIVFLVVFVGHLAAVTELWGILWLAAILAPAWGVCAMVINRMKKKGYNARSTRLVSALAVGLITVLAINVAGPLILGPMMGENDDIYRDELPLMAEQFLDTGDAEFTNIAVEELHSSLSDYGRYWNSGNDRAEKYDLQYTIVDIHAGFLKGLYQDQMFSEYSQSMAFSGGVIYELEPVGGLERLWRCIDEGEDRLLLFFDSRIVRISINRELTDEELAKVVELLKP